MLARDRALDDAFLGVTSMRVCDERAEIGACQNPGHLAGKSRHLPPRAPADKKGVINIGKMADEVNRKM